MSLLDRLNDDMKQAMKNKEKKKKLTTIRMVKSALQNEGIKLQQQPLSEEAELTVLTRELKQRKDSLLEFEKKAGREDLVDKIKGEIAVFRRVFTTAVERRGANSRY
ncbi:hypothetical protein GCM10020331_038710 [Ectobacillus funiculus]